MAGDKSVTGRLLHDDVYDILTVEVARTVEERLFAIVVIFREVLEFPIPSVIVATRRCVSYRPAGEGPGCLPDVRLRVVGARPPPTPILNSSSSSRPQFSLTACAWLSQLSSQ